jgi:hypothetical protein
LLSDGKVLVAGGADSQEHILQSAELYDPVSETWTATGNLVNARSSHTATLLPNGKVLVAGDNGAAAQSAELYDPATGSWTVTGNSLSLHSFDMATLLPNGKVLVTGIVELYDPASGSWTPTGHFLTDRDSPSATLLPNGKVLVAGGLNNTVSLTSAELYDPASGTWTVTASLATGRYDHTSTLLTNGKVLVTGGAQFPAIPLSSAELYDVGLGFTNKSQPKIDTIKNGGNRFLVKGKHFQGLSQASGGNSHDSSSNYPIVQLRGIDNSQVAFLPLDSNRGWSDKSFASGTITDFPSGPALLTVFTNGIPSTATYLVVAPTVSGDVCSVEPLPHDPLAASRPALTHTGSYTR